MEALSCLAQVIFRDEIYEHLNYDGADHIYRAVVPEMVAATSIVLNGVANPTPCRAAISVGFGCRSRKMAKAASNGAGCMTST